MEFVIYFCPVIVVAYIIYTLIRYSGTERYEKNHNEYYRDKNFTEYSPIVWSYIINRKFKKESVISTILMYVKKGYITMTKVEDDYEFKIIKPLDEIDELDLWTVGIFYKNRTGKGSIQYLSNFNRYIWIEKTFGAFNQFQNDMDCTIKAYLSKSKIINYVNKKTNKANIIFSFIIVLITFIISIILSNNLVNDIGYGIFFMIGYSLLVSVIEKSDSTRVAHGAIFFAVYFGVGGVNIYKIALLITAFLTFILIYIDDKIIIVKGQNGQVVDKALGLKRYIQDFSNIKNYKLESMQLWDEYYIYSIALGINKVVK